MAHIIPSFTSAFLSFSNVNHTRQIAKRRVLYPKIDAEGLRCRYLLRKLGFASADTTFRANFDLFGTALTPASPEGDGESNPDRGDCPQPHRHSQSHPRHHNKPNMESETQASSKIHNAACGSPHRSQANQSLKTTYQKSRNRATGHLATRKTDARLANPTLLIREFEPSCEFLLELALGLFPRDKRLFAFLNPATTFMQYGFVPRRRFIRIRRRHNARPKHVHRTKFLFLRHTRNTFYELWHSYTSALMLHCHAVGGGRRRTRRSASLPASSRPMDRAPRILIRRNCKPHLGGRAGRASLPERTILVGSRVPRDRND